MQHLPCDMLRVVAKFMPLDDEMDGVHKLWHVWRQAAFLRKRTMRKVLIGWMKELVALDALWPVILLRNTGLQSRDEKLRVAWWVVIDHDSIDYNLRANAVMRSGGPISSELIEGVKHHCRRSAAGLRLAPQVYQQCDTCWIKDDVDCEHCQLDQGHWGSTIYDGCGKMMYGHFTLYLPAAPMGHDELITLN